MWFIDMNTDDLAKDQLIDTRKILGQFIKQAKMQAKHETCLICGQKLPFCNSHTVPQFCLKNIADNGKVKLNVNGDETTGKWDETENGISIDDEMEFQKLDDNTLTYEVSGVTVHFARD